MKAGYAELQPRKRYADGWYMTADGYKAKRVDGKQILEHRQVMEDMIGRPLIHGERVHHMNGKRDDNRPENLELWTGVGTSKKDPHGVRLRDKVLDMLDSLKQDELERVLAKAKQLLEPQE